MARNGDAARGLTAAFMVSAAGGIIGALVLLVALPALQPVVLAFAAPERFMLVVLGILMISFLSGAKPVKGLMAGALGLWLGTVGQDPQLGVARFTFGSDYLLDGLQTVPIIMGLFALPEVVSLAIRGRIAERTHVDMGEGFRPGLRACLVNRWLMVRSAVVGVVGGAIPDDLLPKIVAGLRAATAIADEYQVTLGLENVRSCWGNSGPNAARILAAVDHPRLRAIWDPGNDYVSGGAPYPDGYRAVLPYLVHVHVKDAAVVDAATGLTRWACIGSGGVDYAGQIAALRRDGYDGVISVETHWRKPGDDGLESTRDTLAGLRSFL